jgi:UPF0176 protein
MNDYRVLLFYKYTAIRNPQDFAAGHLRFCHDNDIKGRIYLAEEGINGTVSGRAADVVKYKQHLRSYPEFSDIEFKEDTADEHAFKKIYVRVRDEIVNSELNGADPRKGGRRLKPEELKEFYESGKDFVIVDARNTYESILGKFHNAVTPDMDNFRDWKKAAESLEHLKDKTIVTYCTGGIRCEKASAYLLQNGFKNVYQLDGGIINYVKKYPDTFWEGGIFVFDERRVLNPNSNSAIEHIAKCYFCGSLTSYYINCHNVDCDKLIVSCHPCKVENDYCCSDECRKSANKRKTFHG